MLRYLKAVQMMKRIIEDNNLVVMSTIARLRLRIRGDR